MSLVIFYTCVEHVLPARLQFMISAVHSNTNMHICDGSYHAISSLAWTGLQQLRFPLSSGPDLEGSWRGASLQ
jgi:hypothetical protein